MEQKLIKSNCFIQALKRKIENPKGKFGYAFKKENGHLYFFYVSPEGKVYRFGRKLRRHSNKNRFWFVGYVYIEGEMNTKRPELPTKRYIVF